MVNQWAPFHFRVWAWKWDFDDQSDQVREIDHGGSIMQRIILSSLIAGAFFITGCLPGDTRPEPARVYVTAEASDSSVNGFTTDDGWNIRFERLLTGLGNVSLEGETCNEYSGSGYDRLYDFTRPGAEKLGLAYGLDTCDIEFRLRSPSDEALLQQGVSAQDLAFMRELQLEGLEIPENIPFEGALPRTAVYVRGLATRGSVEKRFEWRFVVRRLEISNCESPADGSTTSSIALESAADIRRAITVHGDELFREGINLTDARRFDRFADADVDADGLITLTEMGAVTAPMVEPPKVEENDRDEQDLLLKLPGWAGFMVDHLLPRLAYLDGNRCQIRIETPRMGGGLF